MDRYTLILSVVSICALVQRLLREDVKWFPTLGAPWRGLIVTLLAMVAAPTLDAWLNGSGVVAALIAGVLSALPTVLNLIGSLTSAKAARKVAVSVASIAVLAVAFSGCAALQSAHELAGQAQQYAADAKVELAKLQAETTAALAVLPDVPQDVKDQIAKGFEITSKALVAVEAAINGTAKITDETSLLAIFRDFVDAYDQIANVVVPLIGKAHAGKMKAAIVHEPAVVALAHRKAAQ